MPSGYENLKSVALWGICITYLADALGNTPLGPAIYVDIALIWNIFLNIAADQANPSTEMVLPNGSGLCQQVNAHCPRWFEEHITRSMS